MRTNDMPEIDAALAEDSWNFLQDYQPGLAKGVAAAVRRGVKPDEIRRHIIQNHGENRAAIALRCQQAAAYLMTEQDNGAGKRAKVIQQGELVAELEY